GPAGLRTADRPGRRPRAGPQRSAAVDLYRSLLESRSAQSAALSLAANGQPRAMGDSPIRQDDGRRDCRAAVPAGLGGIRRLPRRGYVFDAARPGGDPAADGASRVRRPGQGHARRFSGRAARRLGRDQTFARARRMPRKTDPAGHSGSARRGRRDRCGKLILAQPRSVWKAAARGGMLLAAGGISMRSAPYSRSHPRARSQFRRIPTIRRAVMSKKTTNLRRRRFLKTALSAGAAVMAPQIIPSSALGRDGAVAPSERIVLGGIGIGNRGTYDLGCFLEQKDVQFVAVCDVKEVRRVAVKKKADDLYGNQSCLMFRDFRELLDRPDIDAVLIATGPNWHATMAMNAAKAGKD